MVRAAVLAKMLVEGLSDPVVPPRNEQLVCVRSGRALAVVDRGLESSPDLGCPQTAIDEPGRR